MDGFAYPLIHRVPGESNVQKSDVQPGEPKDNEEKPVRGQACDVSSAKLWFV